MSVLPEVLAPGLDVVFVGTAASKRSAEVGAPYAGPGNRFWDVLHVAGFTPRRLDPTEFRTVTQYGLGLAGMAPNAIGNDNVLRPEDFDAPGLRAKIERVRPRVLAFVGKRAAREFLGRPIAAYGLQPETVGPTQIWVLPSTSGAALAFWDEGPWHALRAHIRTG